MVRASLLLLMLLSCGASAEETRRLAVLELDVAPGVKVDRVVFSDLARSAVNQRVPGLFVMTRETTEALLAANGKALADCTGECEIETGRKLGADLIISGRIAQVGSLLIVTVHLFSTADGRLIASADGRARSADQLIGKADAAFARLVAALEKEAPPKPVVKAADKLVDKAAAGGSPPTDDEAISFIGLHRGDTIDRAVALFGEPSRQKSKPDQPMAHMTFPSGLRIGFSKANQKIWLITVTAGPFSESLKSKYPEDRRLKVLGETPDALLRTFGPPAVPADSGEFDYESKQAKASMYVTCEEEAPHPCNELAVDWRLGL